MGKSYFLALMACFLLAMQISLADDNIFLLNLRYDSEQKNISFESLAVTYGDPYVPQSEGGENYTVKLTKGTEVIFSDYFTTFFVCLGCENSTAHGITLYLPYNSSAEKAEIWKGDALVLSADLTKLCNKDKICSSPGENYFSCPGDCPSGSGDGICDFIGDGRCDSDCALNVDADCLAEEQPKENETLPEINNSGDNPEVPSASIIETYWWAIPLVAVVIVLAIAYIFLKKRSGNKQESEWQAAYQNAPASNP